MSSCPVRWLPVRVEPSTGTGPLAASEPFYVKLRAELSAEFWRDGEGQLYLGFFLDPLYKVHWNNRAAPVSFELKLPDGITVEPANGQGPNVEADSDADPREFLVAVSGDTTEPIELTVRYFACDDAETFCKPVTQTYRITLERDRDGGSRRSSRRPGGFAANSPPRFRGGPIPRSRVMDPESRRRRQSLTRAVDLFHDFDRDEDGKLTRAELGPDQLELFDADENEDASLSLRELVEFFKRTR